MATDGTWNGQKAQIFKKLVCIMIMEDILVKNKKSK